MSLTLRRLFVSILTHRFASSNQIVSAGTLTGIEHALAQRKLGEKNKQDFKNYKCNDYLHFNKYSYYNTEVFFYKINLKLLKFLE